MPPQALRVEAEEPALVQPGEVGLQLVAVLRGGRRREHGLQRAGDEVVEVRGGEVGELEAAPREPAVEGADGEAGAPAARRAQEAAGGGREIEVEVDARRHGYASRR